ncbi:MULTISPECIES: GntR family transcriptional regulator [unclassified Streptomyces]|uniref:GntR family transcriptional regulator n=1 Tax=unclassified Streptomyces TaxID=2593676 RepID=UPI0036637B6A
MAAGDLINRRSAVPFYSQLKDLILADIQSRGLEPGDRLPGDFELCQQYDVSRTVVRQAMGELEHEGVIRRERGRGTFLADTHAPGVLGHALIGYFEDIQSGSGTHHTVVRRKGLVPASAAVAKDLAVKVGEMVVEVERVRSIDGAPWALTLTQFPLSVGEGLLTADVDDLSLFGVLEQRFGVRFDHARRLIEAGVAAGEVADVLGLSAGAPVLVMRSVSYDAAGRPLERFTGHHRGDLSRLEVDVRRQTD